MAILFGSDHYPDRRARELEHAFRQRQMCTVAVAAVVSALLTTGIGVGILWLSGAFSSLPASRSMEAAVFVPINVESAATAPNLEKADGCFTAGNCLPVFQSLETRPIVLEPTASEVVSARASDAKPEAQTLSPDGVTVNKAVAAPAAVQPLAIAEASAPGEPFGAPAVQPTLGATDETRRFIQRGRSFIAQGDVTTARLFFERAADQGDIAGTFALAETYDPIVLVRWRARNVAADPDRARTLYQTALAAGIPEARHRIGDLAGN
jgi:hypothetical protein